MNEAFEKKEKSLKDELSKEESELRKINSAWNEASKRSENERKELETLKATTKDMEKLFEEKEEECRTLKERLKKLENENEELEVEIEIRNNKSILKGSKIF